MNNTHKSQIQKGKTWRTSNG